MLLISIVQFIFVLIMLLIFKATNILNLQVEICIYTLLCDLACLLLLLFNPEKQQESIDAFLSVAFPHRSTLSKFDEQEESHFCKVRVHLGFIIWCNSKLLEVTFFWCFNSSAYRQKAINESKVFLQTDLNARVLNALEGFDQELGEEY